MFYNTFMSDKQQQQKFIHSLDKFLISLHTNVSQIFWVILQEFEIYKANIWQDMARFWVEICLLFGF